MNISQVAKQIWGNQRKQLPSLPHWKELPITYKQEFVTEIWLIMYLIQREKDKS